jgi:hypothetical protein
MKGSCLCKTIEYEIDSIDMPIAHCHCRTCQKAHAAPFASTAGIMREYFRWLKGEHKLSSFESSPGKLRYFCSLCGSHLVAERVNQPHVIVRVATLDEDPFSIVDVLERNFPENWTEPLPVVVNALIQNKTVERVFENLPDVDVIQAMYATQMLFSVMRM